MAKSGTKTDGLLIGILAIAAGVLILWGHLSLTLVVGLYLIIYGILAIMPILLTHKSSIIRVSLKMRRYSKCVVFYQLP